MENNQLNMNLFTYTTEIASQEILSDNPIHQRLLKAYSLCLSEISGNVLEIGCGEGRGIELIKSKCDQYTGVDKNAKIINKLRKKYPSMIFQCNSIPPLPRLNDNSFDVVISFQVIEHIKNDHLFLQEIRRVLKTGGKAIITTPNKKMSLTRNPWHIREYDQDEMIRILNHYFSEVQVFTITGKKSVMEYYNRNKKSVDNLTQFDFLNLQYRLPGSLLRIPYDILNRINRIKLQSVNYDLVNQISLDDFYLQEGSPNGFDFYCIVSK